jgi:hypothetical protein
MGRIYAPDARFKDPFNEVQGVPAIQGSFEHMFEALDQPRFVVTGRVVQGQQCFLTWDFCLPSRTFTGRDADGARRLAPGAGPSGPDHTAPRLLGRRRRAVRKTARGGRADALAAAGAAQ